MSLDAFEPEIRRAVEEVAALGPGAVAAFDADGTLWHGDLGEEVLARLEREGGLLGAPERPYAIYEGLLSTDPVRAFSFCVEVMRGLEASFVGQVSRRIFAERIESRIFPSVLAALRLLLRSGVEVYVVSASSAIAIREAAPALGVEPRNVLAVEGAVDSSGRLTGEVLPPVTCAGGKVEALRGRLQGRRPAIAFGNGLFDREMLLHAERGVMVAPHGYEGPPVALARSQRWPVHRVATM